MGGASATDIGLGIATGGLYTVGKALLPSQPNTPNPPAAPDAADEAVRNARLMERRKQLGLTGRMSTFLTTAQGEGAGESAPRPASTPVVNLLGG